MQNPKQLAVYIHWPWCLKKCPYCDFNSHVTDDAPVRAYVDALKQQLAHERTQTGQREIVSIFFGGGTPSLMPPAIVTELIEEIGTHYTLADDCEITLEANPTSSEAAKFQAFAAAGVNRFSVGVQNLHDEHLVFLGREHSADEALDVVKEAIDAVGNVNLDLIYGLPNQSLAQWQEDLATAVALGTTHISAYQLTIEPGTAFFGQVRKGQWQPVDGDTEADFFDATRKELKTHQFKNYEISNFAKTGYACKHNVHVWRYGDYLGLGAGAHGRYSGVDSGKIATRCYKQPATYIDKATAGIFHFEENQLDSHTQELEHWMLGLRLAEGVSLKPHDSADESGFTNSNIINENRLKRLMHLKLIQSDSNRVKLSESGWPLLESILPEILEDYNA